VDREPGVNFNRVTESDLTVLRNLLGVERVSTGQSELELHSMDETYHRGYLPEVVMWPKTTEEVSRILKIANERMIPVTPWGAGTSLEGNPLPVYRGIVLDFQQMDRILAVHADAFQVEVQPGIKYQDLNKVLSRDGLFYAPDPGANATIGGMVANNASGVRTVKYGGTKDNVLKLETLRLFGIPEKFSAAIVHFNSVEEASRTVYEIMGSGLGPAALELLDQETIRVINLEGHLRLSETPTLFLEFTGASELSLKEDLNRAREICEGNQATGFQPGVGREERNQLWEARHQAYEFIKRHHPGLSFMIIDTAVPISHYSAMIRFAEEAVERHGIKGYLFGHAGDGNLHVVVAGNFEDPDFIERRDRANEEIVFHALSLGGTATGEHGVGIGKRKFMVQEHGASLGVMTKIKHLLDPKGILNPGKIFP
jgi:D-lactate dehydrogenase (cytochrome)